MTQAFNSIQIMGIHFILPKHMTALGDATF